MKRFLAVTLALLSIGGAVAAVHAPSAEAGLGCTVSYGNSLTHTGPPTDWKLITTWKCAADTTIIVKLHKHDATGWHFLWSDRYVVPISLPYIQFGFITHDYNDTCSNSNDYTMSLSWVHGSNSGIVTPWGPDSGLNACN